jgi:hypothetical protein
MRAMAMGLSTRLFDQLGSVLGLTSEQMGSFAGRRCCDTAGSPLGLEEFKGSGCRMPSSSVGAGLP